MLTCACATSSISGGRKNSNDRMWGKKKPDCPHTGDPQRKWGWIGHTVRKPATNITSTRVESPEEKEGWTAKIDLGLISQRDLSPDLDLNIKL